MTTRIVFGATGLLGSAFMRRYPDAIRLSSKDVDCANQEELAEWFHVNDRLFDDEVEVFLCMGKVSGIAGQDNFLMLIENSLMALNTLLFLNAYMKNGRVIYFSSSCVYPRGMIHPLKPEDLLKAPPEKTNEGYALAKIIGTKIIEYMNDDRFYCVVPPNLCGPNDNWDPNHSHVLQAMIRKIYEAKETDQLEVEFWGDPETKREYLYVDDLVRGVEHFLNNTYSEDYEQIPKVVHIGYNGDFALSAYADMIARRIGYRGQIKFNGQFSGNPRKLLNSDYMKFVQGWKPTYSVFGIIDRMVKEYENVRERT